MECEQARELLSAQLDDEADVDEAASARAHRDRCASCRVWGRDVGRVNRELRIRIAEAVPDVASPVLARSHPAHVGRWQWIRLALAMVALAELALAAPRIVLGEGAASIHDARHLGSFGAAVSLGLLYVAWRPIRAYGILPIVVALALTMLATALIDIAQARTDALGEAHHVLELAGLILVWMLAGRPAPGPLRRLITVADPTDRLRPI